MEQLKRRIAKSGLDASDLQKMNDEKQKSYSARIRYAHQRLIEEGRPEKYVMTKQDVATALGISKEKLQTKLFSVYKTKNLEAILNGLGLPNNYTEEY